MQNVNCLQHTPYFQFYVYEEHGEREAREKMLKHFLAKVKLTFNWMMLELLLTRKLQTYRINSFAVLDNVVSAFYADFCLEFLLIQINNRQLFLCKYAKNF